jgi:sugar phosphate isomerase/epimerase
LVEIPKIAQVLKEAGYRGFLAFETDMPHPDWRDREEEMVARSVAYLKRVASELN